MNFKMYQPVWYRDELWIYLGMTEDGAYVLFRPQKQDSFNLIEFEYIYATEDDDLDNFYKQNGEPFNAYCKRKGIELPKKKK
jgi:hypothetical protein